MVQRKKRKTEVPIETSDKDVVSISDLCQLITSKQSKGNEKDCIKNESTSKTLEDVLPSMIYASDVLQDSICRLQESIDNAKKPAIATAPVASTAEQATQLIAYAHKLSFTTSAPHGFVPGKTPLVLFKPPVPQDIHMRSSILHTLQRKYEEQKAAAAYSELGAESLEQKVVDKSPLHPVVEPQPVPSNLADILESLPPMPEGWKPGDDIPGLPPLSAQEEKVTSHPMHGTADTTKTITTTTTLLPSAAAAAAKSLQIIKEEEKPVFKPVSAAFDFALNPDMEIEFEASDDDDDDDSSSESD